MQQVLEQLTRIPGVVGALVAGPHGELLSASFPPLFDEGALRQVAGLLSDDTAGLRKLAGPDGSLDVRYVRGRALAKPFAHGTLLVIGTPAVDAQLLALSLEQAARWLDDAPRSAPMRPPPPASGPAPSTRAELPPEVGAARAQLQEALVRQIGPIGELVFAEAWAAWSAAAPPSKSGLGRLVEELAREVEDPDDRARFLAAARAAIG